MRRLGTTVLVAGLTATALTVGPAAAGDWRAEPLPCQAAARPSNSAPTRLPGAGVPVCRAEPSARVPASTGLPRPRPGYHHLGATTVDTWPGVLGRLAVTDPQVRPDTYDFVATRFLAKRADDRAVHWLEAGWAETGWSGHGRQRVYSFDSARDEWLFFDQYDLSAGARTWFFLEAGDTAWRAWLWWGDAWHLLATGDPPATGGAQIEQYVEVYVDPAIGGSLAVPTVDVDNVQVRDATGALRYWRADPVPTNPGEPTPDYCLTWQVSYDTWSAGSCPSSAIKGKSG